MYILTKKVPDENDDVYIGSTTMSMKSGMSMHKYDCQNEKFYGTSKLYVRMRQVGLEKWGITPLFEKTCKKDEIRKLEKKWVEFLDADLNMISPFLDDNVLERKRVAIIQKRNVNEKKYFCEFCEKAFQSNYLLTRHKDSLKHQYAYLNSLD